MGRKGLSFQSEGRYSQMLKRKGWVNEVPGKVTLRPSSQAKQCHVIYFLHALIAYLGIM